jgi:uncharacterized protein YnzC (UPF0291/DUF896 family)
MDERNDYNSIPEQQVLNKITRFEVIDQTGRIFVTHSVKDIQLSYQDEGRTLKVFLKLDNDTKRI